MGLLHPNRLAIMVEVFGPSGEFGLDVLALFRAKLETRRVSRASTAQVVAGGTDSQ